MINLLPPVQQKEIRAAYANVLLLRYALLLVGAIVFLMVAFGITYLSLAQTSQRADETKQQNEQQASGYAQTQAVATKLRSDLSSAKSLFDNEVLYSKVLVRFSGLLPSGSSVESLQLSDDIFTEPATINVFIQNKAAAEALERNFAASPYIVSSSLTGVNTSQGAAYPYTANLQFTFDRSIGQ